MSSRTKGGEDSGGRRGSSDASLIRSREEEWQDGGAGMRKGVEIDDVFFVNMNVCLCIKIV